MKSSTHWADQTAQAASAPAADASNLQWQQWCLRRLGGFLVAVEFHAPTRQPCFCRLRTYLDEGSHVFCLLSTRICTAARGYHKRRSPKLYRRCSICSAVPRLTDCPLPMAGTLLRPLPWSALGIQCRYPSSTPWYSASRCVFDQDPTLAHLPGLYTGSFC